MKFTVELMSVHNSAFMLINYDRFMETFFLHNTLFLMSLVFGLFILLLVKNFRSIMKEFRISKRAKFWLFLIFIIAFLLRNAEYSYGIHTDGFVYAESARYIVTRGLFVKDCALGNIESCRLYEQVLFPAGYPYLISLLYLLFGVNTLLASKLSAVLSSLTVILVFLIGYYLFRDEEIGLYSALLLSLAPIDLMFASTGNVRSTVMFFMALTVLFYSIALKKNNTSLWALVAITFSYLIYTRQENLVMGIPLFIGLFLFKYLKLDDLRSKSTLKSMLKMFAIPILILIITQIPVEYWLIFHKIFGTYRIFSPRTFMIEAPRILRDFFIPNTYTRVLGFPQLFNPLASILFFSSVPLLLNRELRNKIIFLWVWFLTYFTVYASFAQYPELAGKLFDYVRFIQVLTLPYSLLAATALSRIRKENKISVHIFMLLVFIIIFFTSNIHVPTTLFRDARAEKPVYQSSYFEAVSMIPNGCTVITSHYLIPTSDVFENNQRRTASIWLIFDETKPLYLEEFKNSECLVYVEDWYCNSPEMFEEAEQCKFLQDNLEVNYLFSVGEGENRINVYNASLNR